MNSFSWTTPSVGDVVLLASFPNGPPSPHYGMVAGVFKLEGSHERFLLIAPGTSIKPHYSIDLSTELVLGNERGGAGKSTKFYFNELLALYEFPSADFLESNGVRVQPDQISSVVRRVDNIHALLERIRNNYGGDMMNLYKQALERYGIDIGDCLDLSPKKPKNFLE